MGAGGGDGIERERDSVDAYLGELLNSTALNGTQLAPEAEEPPPAPPFLQFPDQDQLRVVVRDLRRRRFATTRPFPGANISDQPVVLVGPGAAVLPGRLSLFRTKFRLYQARLHMPTVTHKPPQLLLSAWHHRWWSWVVPVFRVSDEELLKSAGMDALIAVKILYFGILCFLPITLAAMAILIPVNYTDDYYSKHGAGGSGLCATTYSTVFIRLTMSNIRPGSSVLWVHFFFVYGAVFWTCWLVTEFYKEYVSLRQAYVIRNTEAAGAHIGGSAEAFEQDVAARSSRRDGSDAVRSSFASGDASRWRIWIGERTTEHPGVLSGPPLTRPGHLAARRPWSSSTRCEDAVRQPGLNHLEHAAADSARGGERPGRTRSGSWITNRSVSFSWDGRCTRRPTTRGPDTEPGLARVAIQALRPGVRPRPCLGILSLYAQEGCSERDWRI